MTIKMYKIIGLSLPALFECETWSLTLSKEHRLRVSENRALKKIYGP